MIVIVRKGWEVYNMLSIVGGPIEQRANNQARERLHPGLTQQHKEA
jgi:hypothetical protein